MLEDRFVEVMQSRLVMKVLVAATPEVHSLLMPFSLTPAMFLHPFYQLKTTLEVRYFLREKISRNLGDVLPFDLEELEGLRYEQFLGHLRQRLAQMETRPHKPVTPEALRERTHIESHLNNLNFHWFESASKAYLHFISVHEQSFHSSTLDQPVGVVYFVDTSPDSKSSCRSLRQRVNDTLKRLYMLNQDRMKVLVKAVVVLFDPQESTAAQSAQAFGSELAKECAVDPGLVFKVEWRGPERKADSRWFPYTRPILWKSFRSPMHGEAGEAGQLPSVEVLSESGFKELRSVVEAHRSKIRSNLEVRIDFLCKRFEENNSAKSKFLNFFNKPTPTSSRYEDDEGEIRELADSLLLLRDFRRAYDLYKLLADKMASRNERIEFFIRENIQVCLALGRLENLSLSSDPVASFANHAESMLKRALAQGKLTSLHYFVLVIYFVHVFRYFDRDFVRGHLMQALRKLQAEEKESPLLSLLSEQFANLNLLFAPPNIRDYSYDLVRAAVRFGDNQLPTHQLRCLLIAEELYREAAPQLLKYITIQLAFNFAALRHFRPAFSRLLRAWKLLAESPADEPSQPSEFQKMLEKHRAIVNDIAHGEPALLRDPVSIGIPAWQAFTLELPDEALSLDGQDACSWSQIGDPFLNNAELVSQRLIKAQFIRSLRLFDARSAEEKEFVYRTTLPTSREAARRVARPCYVGEPIVISFESVHRFGEPVEVEQVQPLLQQAGGPAEVCAEKELDQARVLGSRRFEFVKTPTKAGLLEWVGVQWKFAELPSQHLFTAPADMPPGLQSAYFMLNVLEGGARLSATLCCAESFWEGELTTIRLLLRNLGREAIDHVYLAAEEKSVFPFRTHKLAVHLAPGGELDIAFASRLPSPAGKSAQQRHTVRLLLLYRSVSEQFRTARIAKRLTIRRVAEINTVRLSQLSHSLHLLRLSWKAPSSQLIKSLALPKGFSVQRAEQVQDKEETRLFLFLQENNLAPIEFYHLRPDDPNSANARLRRLFAA